MSNNINPFSPWNVKDYVEDKVNFVSESCEEEMYNSVVVNTDKKSDWLETFFTNNDKNNYDSAVTHAYLYSNKKQPSVPPADKPGPQPPGPGPKPEPPVWPANNIIWYSTTDNENVTINSPTTRFFDTNSNQLLVVKQGELPEPVVFDTHTKVNRYIELSGDLYRINGGAFKNTNNLENIVFPKTLTYNTGGEFMRNSNVKNIVFGSDFKCCGYNGDITSAGSMFRNCMELENIYLYSTITPMFKASSVFAASDDGTLNSFVIRQPQDDNGCMVNYIILDFDKNDSGGQCYWDNSKKYREYIDKLPKIAPIEYYIVNP